MYCLFICLSNYLLYLKVHSYRNVLYLELNGILQSLTITVLCGDLQAFLIQRSIPVGESADLRKAAEGLTENS